MKKTNGTQEMKRKKEWKRNKERNKQTNKPK